MSKVTTRELLAVIEELKNQVSSLTARLAKLEGAGKTNGAVAVPLAPSAPVAPAAPEPSGITEEEVIAISAAIAAYLGVRVHVRQIRLISSHMWAQEGRASVQASHRLHP